MLQGAFEDEERAGALNEPTVEATHDSSKTAASYFDKHGGPGRLRESRDDTAPEWHGALMRIFEGLQEVVVVDTLPGKHAHQGHAAAFESVSEFILSMENSSRVRTLCFLPPDVDFIHQLQDTSARRHCTKFSLMLGRMDGRTDRRTDGRTDGRLIGQACARMNVLCNANRASTRARTRA